MFRELPLALQSAVNEARAGDSARGCILSHRAACLLSVARGKRKRTEKDRTAHATASSRSAGDRRGGCREACLPRRRGGHPPPPRRAAAPRARADAPQCAPPRGHSGLGVPRRQRRPQGARAGFFPRRRRPPTSAPRPHQWFLPPLARSPRRCITTALPLGPSGRGAASAASTPSATSSRRRRSPPQQRQPRRRSGEEELTQQTTAAMEDAAGDSSRRRRRRKQEQGQGSRLRCPERRLALRPQGRLVGAGGRTAWTPPPAGSLAHLSGCGLASRRRRRLPMGPAQALRKSCGLCRAATAALLVARGLRASTPRTKRPRPCEGSRRSLRAAAALRLAVATQRQLLPPPPLPRRRGTPPPPPPPAAE